MYHQKKKGDRPTVYTKLWPDRKAVGPWCFTFPFSASVASVSSSPALGFRTSEPPGPHGSALCACGEGEFEEPCWALHCRSGLASPFCLLPPSAITLVVINNITEKITRTSKRQAGLGLEGTPPMFKRCNRPTRGFHTVTCSDSCDLITMRYVTESTGLVLRRGISVDFFLLAPI